MPSSSKEIELYRNSLVTLMNLNAPSFCASSALVVRPLFSFSPPLPIGAMYMGNGCKSFPMDPSVWLNPCSFVCFEDLSSGSAQSSLDLYYDIAMLRPDLMSWLAPLANAQHLVCDCPADEICRCHAAVLLSLLPA